MYREYRQTYMEHKWKICICVSTYVYIYIYMDNHDGIYMGCTI